MAIKPSAPASRKMAAGASRNADLVHRSLAAVWHPCTQMKHHEWVPLAPIVRGERVWLHDADGNRYLDAISSWWVNLFGHAHPAINAAVSDQLGRLEHVILAGFTHEPAIELAERLSRLAPGRLGHCFFASDGSSAVEIALKMSFHYWQNAGRPDKRRFLSLASSYHGETLATLSVGDVALFKDAYAPLLLTGCRQVPSPDWRNAEPGESAEAFALRCADALERELEQHHAQTAAFIVEPLVQCAGQMGMHHPAYLRRARELCDRYEVLLIADEIAVGFGRTGTLFACEQAGIAPDLICLSKGLTGGYLPLSVVLTTDAIYAAFYADDVRRGFLHSHSYTGNPLACRAALATLDLFAASDVLGRNQAAGERLEGLLAPVASDPRFRHPRRTGMIAAFDVALADADFPRRAFREGLNHEILLRPLGNTVYFMPPYVIEDAELEHMVDAALRTVDAVCG
ncbi:MAG TPA: adenosylmethionine--8-amino-7-oxononanoate transaminase [Pelomicrobium sp.]|nr:adenosylmethionine--8-amino-7-oxononanoate transaminase [Pelomicrobium sp.]